MTGRNKLYDRTEKVSTPKSTKVTKGRDRRTSMLWKLRMAPLLRFGYTGF
jgi:hypothetical protein